MLSKVSTQVGHGDAPLSFDVSGITYPDSRRKNSLKLILRNVKAYFYTEVLKKSYFSANLADNLLTLGHHQYMIAS